MAVLAYSQVSPVGRGQRAALVCSCLGRQPEVVFDCLADPRHEPAYNEVVAGSGPRSNSQHSGSSPRLSNTARHSPHSRRQPLLGDHHPTEHELQITVTDTPGVMCVLDAASASRDPADSHALAAGLAPFSLSWAAGPDGESADNGSL